MATEVLRIFGQKNFLCPTAEFFCHDILNNFKRIPQDSYQNRILSLKLFLYNLFVFVEMNLSILKFGNPQESEKVVFTKFSLILMLKFF